MHGKGVCGWRDGNARDVLGSRQKRRQHFRAYLRTRWDRSHEARRTRPVSIVAVVLMYVLVE